MDGLTGLVSDVARIPCPCCGKRQMLPEDTGELVQGNPVQYRYQFRCGCGHLEPGGWRLGQGQEPDDYHKWLQRGPRS